LKLPLPILQRFAQILVVSHFNAHEKHGQPPMRWVNPFHPHGVVPGQTQFVAMVPVSLDVERIIDCFRDAALRLAVVFELIRLEPKVTPSQFVVTLSAFVVGKLFEHQPS
jgi:hypothetical protein